MTSEEIKTALKDAGYTQNGDVYEKAANGHIHRFQITEDKVKYRAVRDYTFTMDLSVDGFHPDDIDYIENQLDKYL
jgi:hypothetical protein